MRSFYRSLPAPEIIEPVPEIPPIDLAAIAVFEPVLAPGSLAANVVVEMPVVLPVEASCTETIAEPVDTPTMPPKLEIISLERVDQTSLTSRAPRSWRYSVSRWAYRWWLWTREAFRQCFPTSK